MDLSPWARINPCGFQGLQVTQLADLLVQRGAATDAAALESGSDSLFDAVKTVLVRELARRLGFDPIVAEGELPAPVSV